MLAKVSLGINVLLLGLAIFFGVRVNGFSTAQETLTQRVTDLEIQNVQLAKQLAWLDEQQDKETAGTVTGVVRRERLSQKKTAASSAVQSTSEEYSAPLSSNEVARLRADLRNEVEDIVSEKQASSREQRRQEWQDRMHDNMMRSLDDFAEDQQLDDDAKTKITAIINENMNQRRAMRDELDARNLSFYEFTQEERKMREEMAAKLSEVLDEEQLSEFEQAFPMGRRRPHGIESGNARRGAPAEH